MKKDDRLINWDEREKKDLDHDGLDDDMEPPKPDVAAGSHNLRERLRENTSTDPELSGGDIDARWEMAESAGDETVSGSMPTPGQNDVEEMGTGMGVTYQSNEELEPGEKERKRDRKRWELDPASSDDYQDRAKEQSKK
ncbi:MAG: DUF6335 family protein [Thermoanaerobaculia bacterium]